MKPRVVLIDLSSLFWAAWHVHNENGVQEARSATIAGVKRCAGEGHDLVAICCDSGKSFRKELSPEYKANREKQPPAAYGELDKAKARLRADGFLLWESNGFEADDIIATACDKASSAGHEVRVCSADKDLLQLVGTGRDVLRVHTWDVWTVETVREKLKVEPTQIAELLSLTGDSSDNIPGCPGIGAVRGASLVTTYKTIAGIYAALENGTPVGTPAITKALTENRAAVELSRKLVELRYDVPVNFDEIYNERKAQPLTEKSELPSDGDPTDDEKAAPIAAETESEQESSKDVVAAPVKSESNGSSVALVPVVEYERQLEPRSLRAAVWLGEHLFNSRLYQKFTTPEAITAVIIRGRELGLGATTALDCFHVIEGKPSPYAYLMIARAKAHPDCEYFYCKESSAELATWVTKNRRNPVETSVTYTFEQAKTANLVKPNSAWIKRPEDQVVKTAGAKLARREYPDAALGLYAVMELGGDEQ